MKLEKVKTRYKMRSKELAANKLFIFKAICLACHAASPIMDVEGNLVRFGQDEALAPGSDIWETCRKTHSLFLGFVQL